MVNDKLYSYISEDKMLFNLNEFLMSVSFALDYVEMDILGVTTNHGKRTAYTSLKIAKELGFCEEELHDIVALAILHDNGVSEKSLNDNLQNIAQINLRSLERVKEHCTIGEDNISQYPFLTNVKDVIRYHHENIDGSGFFNLKGDEIPLMSQIIHMVDAMEANLLLDSTKSDFKNRALKFIHEQNGKMFSPRVVTAFDKISEDPAYWAKIKEDKIYDSLKMDTPQYSLELSFEEIHKITGVISKIIDCKSKFTQRHSIGLSELATIMADYYHMDADEKMKFIIAADLHDIGKLAIPNSILDSPNNLTSEEFAIIQKHTYYTRLALQPITGFDDIVEWASNHHERLDGTGYPSGKAAKDLDFNSRLMSCLDIYEALTEERPYRKSLTHEEAIDILLKMKNDGYIDESIVQDINEVLRK